MISSGNDHLAPHLYQISLDKQKQPPYTFSSIESNTLSNFINNLDLVKFLISSVF
jgi:hypothetical protein